jgi:hypothetical protein
MYSIKAKTFYLLFYGLTSKQNFEFLDQNLIPDLYSVYNISYTAQHFV